MADSEVLDIIIKAKDEASGVLDGIKGNLGKIGIASAAAGAVITGALGVAVKAAAEAQVQTAKFNATMEAMGAAGAKAAPLIQKAAQAAVQLGFDDEDAANSMAKFFQSTKSVTEAVKLNALAMDLARAKNIDLNSATTLVGQVMAGNGRVLKQYGIDLKEAGSPLAALGELQTKVAGQSKAFAATASGSLAVLDASFGNLKEQIGAALIPALTQLVSAIAPIIQKATEWMEQNPELTKTIVLVVAALGALMVIVPAVIGAITAVTAVISGGTLIAIVALIAGLIALVSNWSLVKQKALEIWNAIAEFFKKIVGDIVGFVVAPFKKMAEDVVSIVTGIGSALNAAWNIILEVEKVIIALIAGVVILAFKAMGIDIVAVLREIGAFIEAHWAQVEATFQAAVTIIQTILRALGLAMQVIWNATFGAMIAQAKAAFELIKLAATAFSEAIKAVFNAAKGPIVALWDSVWGAIKSNAVAAWEGIKMVIKESINFIIDKINSFIQKANEIAKAGAGALGIKVPTFPTIPRLAEGGVVTSPTIALIGEAGPEAVVPLNKAGSAGFGGINIQITINGDVSGEDIVEKIGDRLVNILKLSTAAV